MVMLNTSLEIIRPAYSFDISCQGTVPAAIISFLEANNFEDAVNKYFDQWEDVLNRDIYGS